MPSSSKFTRVFFYFWASFLLLLHYNLLIQTGVIMWYSLLSTCCRISEKFSISVSLNSSSPPAQDSKKSMGSPVYIVEKMSTEQLVWDELVVVAWSPSVQVAAYLHQVLVKEGGFPKTPPRTSRKISMVVLDVWGFHGNFYFHFC